MDEVEREITDNADLWPYYSDERVIWEMFKALRPRTLTFVYVGSETVRYIIVLKPEYLKMDLFKMCFRPEWRHKPVNVFMSIERVRKTKDGRVLKPRKELRRRWLEFVYGRDVVLDFDYKLGGTAKDRFEAVKPDVLKAAELLEDYGAPFSIVFSGSKGFHLWIFWEDILAALEELGYGQPKTGTQDDGRRINELVVALQGFISKKLVQQGIRNLDPSTFDCWKPLIRVPYSVHWKTGLVALPVSPDELPDFSPEDARRDAVLALPNLGWRGWARRPGSLSGLMAEFLRLLKSSYPDLLSWLAHRA